MNEQNGEKALSQEAKEELDKVTKDIEAKTRVDDDIYIDGVVSNSLIVKLSSQGVDRLKRWTSSRLLNYKSLSGNSAEAKLFEDIDEIIKKEPVLDVLEDAQGRLLVQCEGTNRNTVYSVLINKDGEHLIYKFEPTYKPSANPSIPVPISRNRLAPDFAGTQYLYPITGNQKNIVRIKMSGHRNSTSTIKGDFELANIEAGFPGKFAPSFIDPNGHTIKYVWHHLDDFDPITGECTMQLVRQDVHTSVQGMAHTGSVAQYKAFNNIDYK